MRVKLLVGPPLLTWGPDCGTYNASYNQVNRWRDNEADIIQSTNYPIELHVTANRVFRKYWGMAGKLDV